jgi:hypothetical protein
MNTLSEREHAHLARELIKACGGSSEVERVTGLSAGTLSKYSNVGYDNTMPAKLINQLEHYCGVRIYSEALFSNVAAPAPVVDDIAGVSCDLSETVLNLQSLIRRAVADGRLTPREVAEIAAAESKIKPYLTTLEGILRQHDGAGLKVVGQ